MSTSNNNGRALEYIIVKDLIDSYQGNLKESCKYMQLKDETFFNSLPFNLQEKFIIATKKINNWLDDNYDIKNSIINRLDDSQAKTGKSDVTDIRINDVINLSIKHNHNALKHQRPSALAQQCGFLKNSKEDLTYRQNYVLIGKTFLNSSKNICPDATLFSDLKNIEANFINENFYKPVCDLVVDFINIECNKSINNVKFLFKFIIGNIDFTKIILNHRIEIYDYSKIKEASSVKAVVKNSSYVYLSFDNGWNISMRLHTASSRLSTLSLKFDSQPNGEMIKPIIINL